jgi:hypothetical protein
MTSRDQRDHTSERPHAADEIRQNVEDRIANALNRSADHRGQRDITEAIVQDVDTDINDTDRALDRGPGSAGTG